ncbi:MAG: hypothetical protein LUQ07_06380 [Methanospirillum sp.]|nr:hypothetical protein [Methanospirillum sp.]
MDTNRIIFLVVLLLCGIILSVCGNAIMDMQKPVRQESSLLDNYLIMQSMTGKNTSHMNQTYIIGDTGIVVSFNDILNYRESLVRQDREAVVNATSPLSSSSFSNITTPGAPS